MTNYLSEDFTEEFMKRLNEKEIYLLGAECGAGKTTAILEKLLPFVEKNHQQLLYACNRVALKDQLLNKYKKEIIKEEGIVRQNDNLTLGMYQAITNALIKGTEVIYDETYHYIVLDEAHLIYDAADYDFNAYMFLEFINKLDTIIIMMSGTPESVKKLQPYLKKNLKVLREPDKENNPIRNIYLVEDNNVFEELHYQYANNGFKWFELVSFSKQFNDKKSKFHEYNVATLLSDSNKNKDIYMPKESYDEEVLNGITKREEMIADFIFTTKFMDVGVNIKADCDFVVAFDGVEMPNTYEQIRSRIRIEKNSNHIVDMIFHVQRPKKWQIDLLQEKLDYINDLYNEFDGYEGVILKHNLAIGERIRKDGIIQEKDFNPITRSLIEEKLSFFKRMYEAKDLLAFYKDFLKQMYPTKPIINIKSKRVEEVFKELLNGEQSLELSEAQQIELKLKLKDYIVDSKHTNEIPHLKRINNFLLKEKIPYKISNPKRRINGIEKRIWKIEECAR